ncbi:MAG: SEC-C metal-binding domain-containing protein [Desulfitobacteriaceae bacterium]|nr:SEC-C metal-binding domain-containing protein [Desulfitobacteriaceae bacterium]MDD4346215.1 SEC-C metal-binding domain-containing protein [Desulfitobacteriaceae bacterium]MDD4400849.1 SEC-C metal-binding domain-containing protein [Desulfitobacteriaceae bacterium]
MDDQVSQLHLQAGRNDPCPCGSGKKYKKCCMFKDKEMEQLKRDLEEIKDLTDRYFSVKEYIKESGYPVTMFDYFLLEILNITGGIFQAYYKLDMEKSKEILSILRKEAKDFYSACQQCEYACLADPMKTVSLEPLRDQGVPIEIYPRNLQQPVSVNIFYIEFIYVITQNLSEGIKRIVPGEVAEQITTAVHQALIEFISENCWDGCNNECQKEHTKNAYCKFCLFGKQDLPCPKKDEITYNEIMIKEEELIH